MRKIKFRVLNEDGVVIGHEMFDMPFGWHHTVNNDRPCDDGTLPIHVGTITDGVNRLRRDQFTGLTDKSGKEIYEGDIVRIDKRNPFGGSHIKEIMWGQKGSWLANGTYCENLWEFLHDTSGKNCSEVI